MKIEIVENFIKNHPEFTSRKDRYKAMALYYGMEDETIKDMLTFDRYLRDVWPVDEVGIEKEKEYHKSDYIHNWENQLFKPRAITND